jgi:glutathione S-transferase
MSQAERIVIHHIEGRRSERVAWLLEELGVPYELDFIQGDIVGSLLALEKHHEMRMAPVVHIGDLVMVESGAILELLLARYGKASGLRPSEGAPELPAYLEFLHFAEGTAMAKIMTDVTERRMAKALKGLCACDFEALSHLASVLPNLEREVHERNHDRESAHEVAEVAQRFQAHRNPRVVKAGPSALDSERRALR